MLLHMCVIKKIFTIKRQNSKQFNVWLETSLSLYFWALKKPGN